MSRNEVWSLIKDYTKNDPAGKQVYTSLLGNVRGKWRDGELVGIIPHNLTIEAREYGFRIINASVQAGTYTLEKLQ